MEANSEQALYIGPVAANGGTTDSVLGRKTETQQRQDRRP
jgi:hypothetical protein